MLHKHIKVAQFFRMEEVILWSKNIQNMMLTTLHSCDCHTLTIQELIIVQKFHNSVVKYISRLTKGSRNLDIKIRHETWLLQGV